MSLQFYNTLTKKKEEFRSIQAGNIKMYVCGPTVYDYFHIGNARTFVMADILNRYFNYLGFDVKFIMNLTDVDDRIIKKSIEQNITSDEVASVYTKAFFDDIGKLNVKRATVYPKATDNIREMIDIIQNLITDGKAYTLGNDVYYSIEKFTGYGKLSGKNIDELIAGARVDVDTEKKNPLDFALWKGAKEGEPFWESPWGKGRPGWHIECSAMSMKYLGETIDIHCGGNDLIFPHHENEIAQSEGATGKTFANYWIHFGFLNIDNEKMSKSLGNFFTTREILDKYSSNTVRVYFLQTHYSAPLNWSVEGLSAAKNGYERFLNAYTEVITKNEKGEFGRENVDIEMYRNKFIEYMNDDFNTPRAVSVLFDLVKVINQAFSNNNSFTKEKFLEIIKFLKDTLEGVFGIHLISESKIDEIPVEIVNKFIANKHVFEEITGSIYDPGNINLSEVTGSLVEIRKNSKAQKDWPLSDKIRNELKNIGIILEDKKDGTTLWKTEAK